MRFSRFDSSDIATAPAFSDLYDFFDEDREVARHFLAGVLEHASRRADEFTAATADGDWETVKRIAHQMRHLFRLLDREDLAEEADLLDLGLPGASPVDWVRHGRMLGDSILVLTAAIESHLATE